MSESATYWTPAIRVWASPFRNRYGHGAADPRVAFTRCGLRFCWMGWPKGAARPALPPCAECVPRVA